MERTEGSASSFYKSSVLNFCCAHRRQFIPLQDGGGQGLFSVEYSVNAASVGQGGGVAGAPSFESLPS